MKTKTRRCSNPTLRHLAEARVIAAAEKDGVEWREIAAALKLPRSTYFDRRRLATDLLNARRAEDADFDLAEAACR